MDELPPIPGYRNGPETFNFLQQNFRVPQKFKICNGYRILDEDVLTSFSRDPEVTNVTSAQQLYLTSEKNSQSHPLPRFIPRFAALADKRLSFEARFQTCNQTSENVHLRYFLEDDTILVSDLVTKAKIVRRGRIPKDPKTDPFTFYSWKDLNIGVDLVIYGIVYHTTNCDPFTREFLTSQGIQVNPREEDGSPLPKGPTQLEVKSPGQKRLDDSVLHFLALWQDEPYTISFHLSDGTVEVREKPVQGRISSSNLLLRRIKVPKNVSFSADFVNVVDQVEFLSPADFLLGSEVSIFARDFRLLNCDDSTRAFYETTLGIVQSPGQDLPSCAKNQGPFHRQGATQRPSKAPPKDVIGPMDDLPNKLRYMMEMDAVHPEDKNREFILDYDLSNGTVMVKEIHADNSGHRGGVFLSATKLPKPGTDPEDPKHYTPQDFFIGAKINIFQHFFTIKDAQVSVWKYVQRCPEKFDEKLRDNLRNHFGEVSPEVL